MRYLFFDIECADGNKAICEFGFVLCDEHFRIIKKTNTLINPECEFNLTGRTGQKDLILTYPYEEYYKHPAFDDAYDNIKFLMTQPDLLIFGHGVENDIRFIIKDCNRPMYKLKPFDYVVYDIQKMLPEFSRKNSKFTSLEKAFLELVPEQIRNELKDHRAVDDAYKTMLVFAAMLKDLEFSVSDMIEACPKSKIVALEYWKQYKADEPLRKERRKAREQGRKNKAKRDEGQVLWGELYRKHEPLLEDPNSIGKFVTVSGEMKENHEELKNLIRLIEENGFVAYDRINGSDFLIVFDEKNKEQLASGLRHPYAGKIITYQEFVDMCEKK